MLSQIVRNISQLDSYPEFSEFYQEYVKKMQDDILENEFAVNEVKMVRVKSFNSVITQLNELTEELKTL